MHDKISGTFRSPIHAEAFATVRSYIQTAAKHDKNILGVLAELFTTGAWLPPDPTPAWPGPATPPAAPGAPASGTPRPRWTQTPRSQQPRGPEQLLPRLGLSH